MDSPEPPLSGYGQRAGLLVAAVAMAAAAIILCVRAGPVPVQPPNASASDRAVCERLVAALPTTLGGQSARPTTPPSSGLTAAWGRPAITLSCGQPPSLHLVADYTFTVFGAKNVTWFEDAFDASEYFTRVRPILVLHVPDSDAYSGDFSTISSILLAQRGSS